MLVSKLVIGDEAAPLVLIGWGIRSGGLSGDVLNRWTERR
jgi:hypothetical protein